MAAGGMDLSETDSSALRERSIPLLAGADGYRKVLLLGTTAAGKTTVVRWLLGTARGMGRGLHAVRQRICRPPSPRARRSDTGTGSPMSVTGRALESDALLTSVARPIDAAAAERGVVFE
ncbi:hypothetical protein [Nocardia sp. NPDC004123]